MFTTKSDLKLLSVLVGLLALALGDALVLVDTRADEQCVLFVDAAGRLWCNTVGIRMKNAKMMDGQTNQNKTDRENAKRIEKSKNSSWIKMSQKIIFIGDGTVRNHETVQKIQHL